MAERVETGGPAFPVAWPAPNVPELGMSLRDYFAAQALDLAAAKAEKLTVGEMNRLFGTTTSNITHPKIVARLSYEMADAMIAARS